MESKAKREKELNRQRVARWRRNHPPQLKVRLGRKLLANLTIEELRTVAVLVEQDFERRGTPMEFKPKVSKRPTATAQKRKSRRPDEGDLGEQQGEMFDGE